MQHLIIRLYRFLVQHVGHSHQIIRSIFTLSLIDQAFSIGCVYVWKDIIDKYLIRADEWSRNEYYLGMMSLVLLWLAMSFVSRLAKNYQFYKTKVLADQVSMDFMARAYKHVVSLSFDFHESRSSGQVMRQLAKAREDLNLIIQSFFDKLVMQVISFVIVTCFFFYIRWQVALIMLIYIPIFLYFTRRFAKNITQIQVKINDEGEKAYAGVQQALDAFMVVQSFQSHALESSRLRDSNRRAHLGLKRKADALQRLVFAQGTLVNFVRLSIITAGGYFVFDGQMTVGEVVLLSMWGYFIYTPMYQFSDLLAAFAEGMDSVARIEKLLALKPSIDNPSDGYQPHSVKGQIVFNNVSFSYPTAINASTSNVSFTIAAGSKLALVGPSGSGKSTLAKLLPRFYDVSEGSITVDGVDVRQWSVSHLRQAIGIVSQDIVLFNDSIYNNIVYACASNLAIKYENTWLREAAVAAAKKAFAHDFIMTLPQGYDTVVGERGVKLSGGEKQRIGIARTILRNPPILILDEATSALDSESEVIVTQALEQICKEHTTLTIAHRLSTIRHCDQILFCEDGKIVERGDHNSLMALKGRYRTYVALQKQKESLEF
jgi:ABC-type multidrug transport system fused ATPase/permease subunit